MALANVSASTAAVATPFAGAQLLALLDTLGTGTLNATQRETVQALRDGILALTAQETTTVDTPTA